MRYSVNSMSLSALTIFLVVLACNLLPTQSHSLRGLKQINHRNTEEDLDLMESRFYISVSYILSDGAETPFPDVITITCGEGTSAVITEEENLDWVVPDDCISTLDDRGLECSPTVRQADGPTSVDLATHIVVACQGPVGADFDFMQVDLPGATYSVPADVSSVTPGVGRYLYVFRICELDGFGIEHAGAATPLFAQTGGDGQCIGGEYTIDGSCSHNDFCTDAVFGGLCQDIQLPAITRTLEQNFEANSSGSALICTFNADPPDAIPLDQTYQADYQIGFSGAQIGGCEYDYGVVRARCRDGGFISSPLVGGGCQRLDNSTLECDVHTEEIEGSGGGTFSCSGSSTADQLSPAVTWEPVADSIECTGLINGLARTLSIGQVCPISVFIPDTLTGSVDDLAMTCYPFHTGLIDSITVEQTARDPETGEEYEETKQYIYEVCSVSDGACFPDCTDLHSIQTIEATILPKNLYADCLIALGDQTIEGEDIPDTPGAEDNLMVGVNPVVNAANNEDQDADDEPAQVGREENVAEEDGPADPEDDNDTGVNGEEEGNNGEGTEQEDAESNGNPILDPCSSWTGPVNPFGDC